MIIDRSARINSNIPERIDVEAVIPCLVYSNKNRILPRSTMIWTYVNPLMRTHSEKNRHSSNLQKHFENTYLDHKRILGLSARDWRRPLPSVLRCLRNYWWFRSNWRSLCKDHLVYDKPIAQRLLRNYSRSKITVRSNSTRKSESVECAPPWWHW